MIAINIEGKSQAKKLIQFLHLAYKNYAEESRLHVEGSRFRFRRRKKEPQGYLAVCTLTGPYLCIDRLSHQRDILKKNYKGFIQAEDILLDPDIYLRNIHGGLLRYEDILMRRLLNFPDVSGEEKSSTRGFISYKTVYVGNITCSDYSTVSCHSNGVDFLIPGDIDNSELNTLAICS